MCELELLFLYNDLKDINNVSFMSYWLILLTNTSSVSGFLSYRITELTTLGDKLKEQNTKKDKTISALKVDIQKLVQTSPQPYFLSFCQTKPHMFTTTSILKKGIIITLSHNTRLICLFMFLCFSPMSISEQLLVFEP